jgi:hypothetical protein
MPPIRSKRVFWDLGQRQAGGRARVNGRLDAGKRRGAARRGAAAACWAGPMGRGRRGWCGAPPGPLGARPATCLNRCRFLRPSSSACWGLGNTAWQVYCCAGGAAPPRDLPGEAPLPPAALPPPLLPRCCCRHHRLCSSQAECWSSRGGRQVQGSCRQAGRQARGRGGRQRSAPTHTAASDLARALCPPASPATARCAAAAALQQPCSSPAAARSLTQHSTAHRARRTCAVL